MERSRIGGDRWNRRRPRSGTGRPRQLRAIGGEPAAGRPGGQTNAIGYLGGKDGGVNPLDFFRKRVTICGIPVGHRASFEAMNRAIAGTQMKPVIDRSFHWSEIETALAHLASGQHVGKVAPVMN